MDVLELARAVVIASLAASIAACNPQGAAQRPQPAAPPSLVTATALPSCAPDTRRFEGTFARASTDVPEVDIAWLAEHRCEVRVVDVREAEERVGPLGAIDVSQHVPLATLDAALSGWSADEPVVFVCHSGRRSAAAVARARSHGMQRVASLSGGMLAWQASGLSVTRGVAPLR